MALDLYKLQNFVLDNLLFINVPLLILYGQEDQIVNQQDSITLYCKVGNLDKTIKILKEQYHLFLFDSNKQEVIELISQWIDIQSKHNSQKQQEIIQFTQNIPQVNQIKQDFATQIRAESKRKAPEECNSGILSFCSNKSETSIPNNYSDQEFDENDDESESESILNMYNSQKNGGGTKLKSSNIIHTNSLKIVKSQNLYAKDTKQNSNHPINQLSSPLKKRVKRIQETCNICQQLKDYELQNGIISTSESNVNNYSQNKGQVKKQCEKCECQSKDKKPKYFYGTSQNSHNKLKITMKLFLYGVFMMILRALYQKRKFNQILFCIKQQHLSIERHERIYTVCFRTYLEKAFQDLKIYKMKDPLKIELYCFEFIFTSLKQMKIFNYYLLVSCLNYKKTNYQSTLLIKPQFQITTS